MARGGGGRSRPAAPSRAPARVAAPARSAQVPAARPAHPPAQQAQAHPPAPQQPQSGGMLSGFAGTIAQGFAFGTGSAVAHRAVGAIAGSMGGGSDAQVAAAPVEQQHEQQPAGASAAPCDVDQQNFYSCLQRNNGDVSSCQFLFESLQQCQASSARTYA